MRLGIIGGGWAGLAAAVRARQAGATVTLFEMAPQLGGRARSLGPEPDALDSGHHILIGAYRATLALMKTVGVDLDQVMWRAPLSLVNAAGQGLRWPDHGWAPKALLQAILNNPLWTPHDRWGFLRWGLVRAVHGLRCSPQVSVEQLCADLPAAVRRDWAEPLCIAALNTPIQTASGVVFLQVLRDALLGGSGAADLLLPRRPLSELLATPTEKWLQTQGVKILRGERIHEIAPHRSQWRIQGESYDALVLAASATEAARLTQDIAPAWSETAQALPFEAIATVYLQASGVRLPFPMVALTGGPAQFLFDVEAIGGPTGRWVLVCSAVAQDLQMGREALAQAALTQLHTQVPALGHATLQQVHADRRATFACTVGLQRPPSFIAPGLWAAGDYVQGPYPATLEGAIRSGEAAVQAAIAQCGNE
ncbi:hydroxysqualene dehydroxylase HpnE [Inhella gelatinilytica]|uniref:FAD-dependent oxidoreductase n=1 Tax=Inhella gelatinilytica TaxID=2795030 RepID=A0A931IUP3_9BURK|nr:hydroxysqualene dehydroxylase HpnE [Inhella gelatinilytica]MBH9553117.1 FAD-dependent oxidoreductase [Inhella gelatinilytica]